MVDINSVVGLLSDHIPALNETEEAVSNFGKNKVYRIDNRTWAELRAATYINSTGGVDIRESIIPESPMTFELKEILRVNTGITAIR